jgi:hypothetical protein
MNCISIEHPLPCWILGGTGLVKEASPGRIEAPSFSDSMPRLQDLTGLMRGTPGGYDHALDTVG